MHINEVSGQIVDSAIKVHWSEVPMPVQYDGVELDLGYRIDLLVEECVVVEIKAAAKILPVYQAQLPSQLTLSDHRVGLLINSTWRGSKMESSGW